MIFLTRHVPYHLKVARYGFLFFYDEHPATCYCCGGIGHIFQRRPARLRSGQVRPNSANSTYASIASATAAHTESPVADMTIEMGNNTQKDSAVNTTPVFNALSQNVDTRIADAVPLCSA